MSIRPTNAYLVVKMVERQQVTASGLALPDTHRQRSNEGTIVALGPDVGTTARHTWGEGDAPIPGLVGETENVQVRVGDRVLVLRWLGYEVTYEGVLLHVLPEDAIIAVLDDQPWTPEQYEAGDLVMGHTRTDADGPATVKDLGLRPDDRHDGRPMEVGR